MAESRNTGTEDGKNTDKNKARDLMQRDTPDAAEQRQVEKSTDDRDKVYRPDANVDNQKSSKGRAEPGHQTSIDKTPLSGSQAKDKSSQKDNINDTADDAESSRRNG